jgi:glutathione S-transferase
MLKVWGRRNSFNVQKVMWTIGELGLEHEHINAGGSYGLLDDPKYRKMNPNGLVPTIVDKGEPIWESHTIVRYLAAEYGTGSLWPANPLERSQADRWMDWTQTTLGRSFMSLFWLSYRTPKEQQKPRAIAQAMAQTTGALRMLDAQLEGKANLGGGDNLTMGDIPAGTALYRYFEMDLERPALPHVEAWYERLKARAAYQEHVMVPFDELFGRLSF